MLERDILERAWLLIQQAEDWTQAASARDRQGASVEPNDPEACCWCALGAIEKAVADMGLDEKVLFDTIEHLCDSSKALFGTRFINVINDRKDHDAIRQLFDHAIADCRLVEAAGFDDEEPVEVERLRTALGFCLGYINQLEQSVAGTATSRKDLDPIINHIKHAMGLSNFGLPLAAPLQRPAN